MRIVMLISLLAVALLGAACSSRNVDINPSTGRISGALDVVGPFSGAAPLSVGLFLPGSETPVESTEVGRITSAATATLTGRRITFSFSELSFGVYEVAVFATSAGTATFYYRGAPVTLSSTTPTVADFSADVSFTGNAPFGTVSGLVLLEEEFSFVAGQLYFIGLSKPTDPQNALQHLVAASDVNSAGQLFFNIEGVSYGTWLVGLYGYNPETHAVTVHGLLDDPVRVGANLPNVTGAVFPAGATDPGDDGELGTITGTVTFNGALPEGQSLHIAANTIPPQQGAPPATIEVTPGDLNGGRTLNYALPNLPTGSYSVAIFSYDFVNHTAVYFGTLDDGVSVTSGQTAGDADFNADVTVIGGTAD